MDKHNILHSQSKKIDCSLFEGGFYEVIVMTNVQGALAYARAH